MFDEQIDQFLLIERGDIALGEVKKQNNVNALIMLCCLSMMNILRCSLAVTIMVNNHATENSVQITPHSTLTVGDRQSRHWRRGDCVRPSRSVVVVARARVLGDGRFLFFFVRHSVLRALVVARC